MLKLHEFPECVSHPTKKLVDNINPIRKVRDSRAINPGDLKCRRVTTNKNSQPQGP